MRACSTSLQTLLDSVTKKMSKFLDLFPTIDYPGFGRVRDITVGLKLQQTGDTIPYTQPAGIRPDAIASKYYGDPVKEWLLFLVNDIDDPRDLVYLTEDQFSRMIVRQYGSVERAQKLTKHYKHNWRDVTESSLTQQEFDSLPAAVQPLFDVTRDYRGEISGYVRKQVDVIRNTNITYKVTVAQQTLSVGEPVSFAVGSTVNGTGEVTMINGNDVFVSNVINSAQGTSLTDGTNVDAIESIELVSTNIAPEEVPYFTRVSVYDFLYDLNEQKRSIQVIDKRIAGEVQRQLEQAFD